MKKLKKIMKRSFITIILLFICILILGFFSSQWEPDDAVIFVESALDSVTKGDVKKFSEMADISEKKLKSEYEDELDEFTKIFDSIKSEKYNKRFSKKNVSELLRKTKYHVASAKKTKDGFDVKVIVNPFIGFNSIESELADKITLEALQDAGIDPENEEEVDNFYRSERIDLMIQKIKKPTYGADKEMMVRVKGSNDDYFLSDLDMQKCVGALMSDEFISKESVNEHDDQKPTDLDDLEGATTF